jgi:hypothetical protein
MDPLITMSALKDYFILTLFLFLQLW